MTNQFQIIKTDFMLPSYSEKLESQTIVFGDNYQELPISESKYCELQKLFRKVEDYNGQNNTQMQYQITIHEGEFFDAKYYFDIAA